MVKTHSRRGFTLLEVLLFLAISALIFAGIMMGATTSIARHRYNDSVQEFVDFMRIAYDDVIYTHNTRLIASGGPDYCSLTSIVENGVHLRFDGTEWLGGFPYGQNYAAGYRGRSNCSIYGRLITFGEDDQDNTAYEYAVAGIYLDDPSTALPSTAGTDETIYALSAVNNSNTATGYVSKGTYADVISMRVKDWQIDDGFASIGIPAVCKITAADASYNFDTDGEETATSFPLRWGATFETPDGQPFRGSLLIVRSPIDGLVHTYFLDRPINARRVIENDDGRYTIDDCVGKSSTIKGLYNHAKSEGSLLSPYLNQFRKQTVDICIDSDDARAVNGRRRNIRIADDGHNASSVELVAADDDSAEGNRCN